MLTTLAVANYRSIRQLVLPLGPLNVVTGPNGSGKSNLYKALRLLADTAQGGVVATLAREGGLTSTLWAGPENISRRMKSGEVRIEGGSRRDPINLRLGFGTDDLGYAIDLGIPTPDRTLFTHDPEIKRECIFAPAVYRPASLLVDRRGASVRARDDSGEWRQLPGSIAAFDSIFAHSADPERTPEVLRLREMIRSWRFYDHFRVDPEAPARQPFVGTRSPVLASDGRDLAAALQTILEIGDGPALQVAIDDAFAGASVRPVPVDGRLKLEFVQPGLLRPLSAAELSDGTLRYLLWVAALLTPRPPPLMVLNEPETSLHPELLPALARLIIRAAEHTQIWVVSHATRLVAALKEAKTCHSILLEKPLGQTEVSDYGILDEPQWKWPER